MCRVFCICWRVGWTVYTHTQYWGIDYHISCGPVVQQIAKLLCKQFHSNPTWFGIKWFAKSTSLPRSDLGWWIWWFDRFRNDSLYANDHHSKPESPTSIRIKRAAWNVCEINSFTWTPPHAESKRRRVYNQEWDYCRFCVFLPMEAHKLITIGSRVKRVMAVGVSACKFIHSECMKFIVTVHK